MVHAATMIQIEGLLYIMILRRHDFRPLDAADACVIKNIRYHGFLTYIYDLLAEKINEWHLKTKVVLRVLKSPSVAFMEL